MSSDESSSDDEINLQDYDEHLNPRPHKLEQLTDKYVQKIVQGVQLKIDDEGDQFWDLLHEKLTVYPDNANCIYYAAICFDENDQRRKQWLEKAVKLGHREAMFEYGRLLYDANREESIASGVEAIKAGHREKHKTKLGDIFFYQKYYAITLENYISQLEQENARLKSELQEEQLRPPELGGSEYIQAKDRFTTLQQ